MATIRQRKSGSYEIIIRRSFLPKPVYASADTEAEAVAYAQRVEQQLDAGIVPKNVADPGRQNLWTVQQWLEEYETRYPPCASDRPLLPIVIKAVGQHFIHDLSFTVIEPWIEAMKAKKLTPGSIKKRVGALKRALDVAVARNILKNNPLAGMPRNYSAYGKNDGVAVTDVERDRRLEPGEEEQLRAVLAEDPDLLRLFTLALETGMRLSELYTLTWSQVDLEKRTIFLDRTKNGDKRQVPMSSIAVELLKSGGEGLVFPFFRDGDRRKTTLRIGYHWSKVAKQAGCEDLRFHDLRHEATCRFFERTTLSDLQISRITGHRDPRMLRRYANLRGSDLAEKLW